MTSVFGLLAKTLSGQVPPRVLVWGFLNTLNRSLKTGNRRFEFERLYLENPDPWNYATNPYERQKYERVLACALRLRKASNSALEVGCSVGVFTGMLAKHFDKVTAIDFSKEALVLANYNHAAKNVRFMHRELRRLNTHERYDVIFCAEVLNYVQEKYVSTICQQLENHISRNGIIVLVTGLSTNQSDSVYFEGWADVLATHFEQVLREVVSDPSRPYLISIFSRQS